MPASIWPPISAKGPEKAAMTPTLIVSCAAAGTAASANSQREEEQSFHVVTFPRALQSIGARSFGATHGPSLSLPALIGTSPATLPHAPPAAPPLATR